MPRKKRARVTRGYACDRCDGTGWIDVPAPPGELTGGKGEQPWLAKCPRCEGAGRVEIGVPAGADWEGEQPTDAALTRLWREHDQERRMDGEIYFISTGKRMTFKIPERMKPPLPDGSRPGGTK